MPIPVLFCPVINRSDLLLRLVHSINYPVGQLVILNNGTDQGVIDILAQLSQEIPNLVIYTPGRNLGVSASWNWALKQYPNEDYILIVGSDIAFAPNDLRLIDEGMRRHPEYVIRPGCHGHSFFGIRQECVENAGFFEESFFPGWLEDSDHMLRINRLGLPWADIGKAPDETEQCHAVHGTAPSYGSHSIHDSPDLLAKNRITFQRNLEFYQRKWGGMPGHETFTHPFNDPSWPLNKCANDEAHIAENRRIWES